MWLPVCGSAYQIQSGKGSELTQKNLFATGAHFVLLHRSPFQQEINNSDGVSSPLLKGCLFIISQLSRISTFLRPLNAIRAPVASAIKIASCFHPNVVRRSRDIPERHSDYMYKKSRRLWSKCLTIQYDST